MAKQKNPLITLTQKTGDMVSPRHIYTQYQDYYVFVFLLPPSTEEA